ncbi:nuclear transport factor 2 family protein [Streptomyces europaeiscabiei]|uniref:nuclear transport factor 2 family protein n=1 Tax=Streptomyces europaeiscabiei TaxID=146819 RepID=UPI002E2A8279|nr:nuclear transport factor 2 family protein [Streptomyces europaeiscabiei]
MTDFSIVDGIADIHTPELYRTWMDRPDYIDAVAASADPDVAATKRIMIEFVAELARMIRDAAVDERIRDIVERYVTEEFVQHDPNAPGNGREQLIEFLRHAPLDGGPPPAVVNVMAEGELASVMTRQPTPDPLIPGSTYDWYSLAVFRLGNGRLSEHWGPLKKLAA